MAAILSRLKYVKIIYITKEDPRFGVLDFFGMLHITHEVV